MEMEKWEGWCESKEEQKMVQVKAVCEVDRETVKTEQALSVKVYGADGRELRKE